VIREAILGGVSVYIVITVLQIYGVTTLAMEGLVFCGSIIAVAALYRTSREHLVEKIEILALWGSVLLFAAYGIGRLGGWI
jgi:hypothetical protein